MQTGFTFICTTTIRYDRNIMMLHKTKKIEIAYYYNAVLTAL